jgi:hypothetical protein
MIGKGGRIPELKRVIAAYENQGVMGETPGGEPHAGLMLNSRLIYARMTP